MTICNSCHAGCCRRYYVDLTGFDIVNISETLNLDYLLFTQTVPVKDEEVEELSKDAALFKFTDDNCQRYYRFCVNNVESKLMDKSMKCMFLQEWNGETLRLPQMEGVISRCGIYGCRPLTCSIYPAKMDVSGVFGYILDPYINTQKKDNPAYNVCSRKMEEPDYCFSSRETTKNLALHKFEMDFFKKMAENWNQNPGSLKEFFDHLVRIYSNRIVYEAGESLEKSQES